jgi:hypothetical protein
MGQQWEECSTSINFFSIANMICYSARPDGPPPLVNRFSRCLGGGGAARLARIRDALREAASTRCSR